MDGALGFNTFEKQDKVLVGLNGGLAEISLSRIAEIARPARERIRLSTTTSVISTRIMPMVKVEVFLMPVMPMAPLIRILPSSAMFIEAASLREKCRPLSSTPR